MLLMSIMNDVFFFFFFWSSVFVEGTCGYFLEGRFYGRNDIVFGLVCIIGIIFRPFFNLWPKMIVVWQMCLTLREKGKCNMDILVIRCVISYLYIWISIQRSFKDLTFILIPCLITMSRICYKFLWISV